MYKKCILIILCILFMGTDVYADSKLTLYQQINSEDGTTGVEDNNITLYKIEDDKKIKIDSKKTDKDGKVEFSHLKEGDYVAQDDKKNEYSIGEQKIHIENKTKKVSLKSSSTEGEEVIVVKKNKRLTEKPENKKKEKKENKKKENKKTENKKKEKKENKILIPATGQTEIFLYTIGGGIIFFLGLILNKKFVK